MTKRRFLIILFTAACFCTSAQEVVQDTFPVEQAPATQIKQEKKPDKALLFFYRSGNWVDRYLMKGIDPDYIELPEHCWRLAFTAATIGINSTITSTTHNDYLPNPLQISLLNRTIPSVDLGFYAGYRSLGFGYSWDAIHAYAQRWSLSLGSKFIGLDFSLQTSTNISTRLAVGSTNVANFGKGNVVITNANLSMWYALNAAHYSHNAAVKQSYIQKRTAGSFLLHLSYMSSRIALSDSILVQDGALPTLPALMSNVTAMQTRQVAVGLGYGINYTPNNGKVLLHLSAAAMLVTYSINHISYYIPDSVMADMPAGEPMFNLRSRYPVHITGNMRAAVSWEINKWVHLSAYATADHLSFRSVETANENKMNLKNWNWKTQFTVGVRFGAGKDKVQKALHYGEKQDEKATELVSNSTIDTPQKKRPPQWITDFFWSPKE